MSKDPIVLDFMLGDLLEMLRDAGYSWSQGPRELNSEALERLEKKYALPPCPKYVREVVSAAQIVFSFLVYVIRNNPPETDA